MTRARRPGVRRTGGGEPRPYDADPMPGGAGFTLLELLVVVSLLALTVTLVVPRFQDLTGERLRASTRMLAGSVRYVHAEAATTQQIYRIEIDLEESSFWVSRCVPSAPGQCEWAKDTASLSGKRILPDGVRFESVRTVRDELPRTTGVAHVHFLPRGYVEQAVILLEREHGDEAFTLLVLPIGGRVKILDGRHDLVEGRLVERA